MRAHGASYSITAIGSVICRSRSIRSVALRRGPDGGEQGAQLWPARLMMVLTMATYGAQNVGASRHAANKGNLYSASLMGFGYSLLAFGVAWFFGVLADSAVCFRRQQRAARRAGADVDDYKRACLPAADAGERCALLMIQGMGFSMSRGSSGPGVMGRWRRAALRACFLCPRWGILGAALGSPAGMGRGGSLPCSGRIPARHAARRRASRIHSFTLMGESAGSN